MEAIQRLQEARDFLINKGVTVPDVGIVLGTGLHELINGVVVARTIPYASIPHFPLSTVEFHKGQLVYGALGNKKVLVMQGRFHAYEGYTLQQVVFPVQVMKLLGIKSLLLSNAAGGINAAYRKGDLVLVDDHINLLAGNPLSGKNLDDLGSRFPDMSAPYDLRLQAILREKANSLGIPLHKGVYAAVHGPNLETRAEYRFLRTIGADLVGMSTVPEVIAAAHMQLPCAAVSVVTDECDPDHLLPVNIAEIIEVAGRADKKLAQLFAETIKEMP